MIAGIIKVMVYAGFILERGLAGFPQFEKKKDHIKVTLARQMGRTNTTAP